MTQTCMQRSKYRAGCALVQHEFVTSTGAIVAQKNYPTQLERMQVGDKQSHAYTSSAKLN